MYVYNPPSRGAILSFYMQTLKTEVRLLRRGFRLTRGTLELFPLRLLVSDVQQGLIMVSPLILVTGS
jgi:hypothetical protein